MGDGSGVFPALQALSSAVLWNVGGRIKVDGTLAEIAAAASPRVSRLH